MEDKILKVVLDRTLKRFDGSLIASGVSWTGTISDFPEEIQLAIKNNKKYITITELPQPEKIAEVVQDSIPEVESINTQEAVPSANTEETSTISEETTEEVKTETVSAHVPIEKKKLVRGKRK